MIQHSLPQVNQKASAKLFTWNLIKIIGVQSFKYVQNPTTTNPMESIVGGLIPLIEGASWG
jgi:hypothetical protein